MIFVLALALIVSNSLSAQQKGETAAGGYFAYGTGDGFSNFGLGAKFQWNPIDNLRLEPSFTYFFKKDLVSMWDFSTNVHYLFPVTDKVIMYPLAGLGMIGSSVSIDGFMGNTSTSSTKVAFGFGGGVDFDLNKNLVFNLELKYKLCDGGNRLIISAGLNYKF